VNGPPHIIALSCTEESQKIYTQNIKIYNNKTFAISGIVELEHIVQRMRGGSRAFISPLSQHPTFSLLSTDCKLVPGKYQI